MSYRINMEFEHEGDPLFDIRSQCRSTPADVIISTIFSLINILEFSEYKIYDNDVIDGLKARIESFRKS